MNSKTGDPLLSVDELVKVFREGTLTLRAVNGISFDLDRIVDMQSGT